MGDFNQLLWVEANRSIVRPPILEVGSKFYSENTFIDYRVLFPEYEYIGADLSNGKNVDVVCDFTNDIESIRRQIGMRTVGTIICCSVLEHVSNIFDMARNISDLLVPGGVLFVSVPFVWEYHGYPDDYWRMTPNGVKHLFSQFEFPESFRTISSNINYDIEPLGDDPNTFMMRSEIYEIHSSTTNPYLRKFKRFAEFVNNGRFRQEYLQKKIFGKERRFPNTSINMIGIKK